MKSNSDAQRIKKQFQMLDVETFHFNQCSTNGLVMDAEHSHNYHEILFNFSSIPINHTSNGYSHKTETPFILYRAPNILHSSNTLSDQTYSRCVLAFSSALLEDHGKLSSLGKLQDKWECLIPINDWHIEDLKPLLFRLKRYKEENAPLDHIIELISIILYEINGLVPGRQPEQAMVPAYIKEIVQYISGHLSDDLSINNLAKIFFVSRTKLIEDFYRNRVEMKPGAMEFLKYLSDNGVRMCIASASALDMVEIAVERCGLDRYIPKLLSSCDYGCGKDKPDVYLGALEYLGTKAEETWVFEDSLVALKTAKSIGMPVVGIYDAYNFGHDEMEKIADYYIADGEGLDKLIAMRAFE